MADARRPEAKPKPREYRDLSCPVCTGVLFEVCNSGVRNWFCQRAIGESGIDVETGRVVMDEGAVHREVYAWSERDGWIRGALAEYRSYVRIERKGARRERAA